MTFVRNDIQRTRNNPAVKLQLIVGNFNYTNRLNIQALMQFRQGLIYRAPFQSAPNPRGGESPDKLNKIPCAHVLPACLPAAPQLITCKTMPCLLRAVYVNRLRKQTALLRGFTCLEGLGSVRNFPGWINFPNSIG